MIESLSRTLQDRILIKNSYAWRGFLAVINHVDFIGFRKDIGWNFLFLRLEVENHPRIIPSIPKLRLIKLTGFLKSERKPTIFPSVCLQSLKIYEI
jgi:hypothetical protein